MRILENAKSSYPIRFITYLILTLFGAGLILYYGPRGYLLLLCITFLIYGFYFIISDLLSIKKRKQLTPVESKSKEIYWAFLLPVLLGIGALNLSPNKDRATEGAIFFFGISIFGIIKTLREETLVSNNETIQRLNFLTGGKVKWSDINTITREEGKIIIQSTNKDFISINTNKSTAREVELIEGLLRDVNLVTNK